MFSKMFLQFGKGIKIQRHQVGAIWWVIQDGETKASNLYNCSHTFCVVQHCHVEGEDAPCEDELIEFMLQASPVFHSTAQS
jgi:hypothetical protein